MRFFSQVLKIFRKEADPDPLRDATDALEELLRRENAGDIFSDRPPAHGLGAPTEAPSTSAFRVPRAANEDNVIRKGLDPADDILAKLEDALLPSLLSPTESDFDRDIDPEAIRQIQDEADRILCKENWTIVDGYVGRR